MTSASLTTTPYTQKTPTRHCDPMPRERRSLTAVRRLRIERSLAVWLLFVAFVFSGPLACSDSADDASRDASGDEEPRRERPPPQPDPGDTHGDETDTEAGPGDVSSGDPDPDVSTEDTSDTTPTDDASEEDDASLSDIDADSDVSPDPDDSDTSTRDVDPPDAIDDTDDVDVPDTDEPVTTPLDPQLATPPASNQPCTWPGSMGECDGIAVCRHYVAEESRCESCEPCGNLNAFCSASIECDILFTCFQGRCTAACSFETPQTCGVPTDCIDVGHPTHGVCRPF